MLRLFRRLPIALAVSQIVNQAVFSNGWDPDRYPRTPYVAVDKWTLTNSNRTFSKIYGLGGGFITGFALGSLSKEHKSVWEVTQESEIFSGRGPTYSMVGFSLNAPISGPVNDYLSSSPGTAGIYWTPGQNGAVLASGGDNSVTSTVGSIGEFAIGDTIAFAYDPVLGTICIYKNGEPLNSGNPVYINLIGKTITPAVSLYNDGGIATINGGTLKYDYPGYTS